MLFKTLEAAFELRSHFLLLSLPGDKSLLIGMPKLARLVIIISLYFGVLLGYDYVF